jgi:A/G-specific adenine glycosylase
MPPKTAVQASAAMPAAAAPDAMARLTPRRVGRIQRALLGWYEEHASPFPWRESRNPYHALVAGVCSQQTQMSRVLPLWERWMAAFPTLDAAAQASTAEVLRVWAGAGYPKRALALRDTARRCLELHDGALPRDYNALLALPGVGPFTAAIVLCLGWADPAVAIDTNVVRVIGRLVHGDLQPAKETAPAAILEAAQRLLPRAESAHWNPALMDYGGRICTPRPHCDVCVVARECAARPRFANGERATPVRRQASFDGSDRQWRGRIMRALRAQHGPMRTSALTAALATTEAETALVRRLLATLVTEGMAWRHGSWCGLGDRPEA